MLTATAAPLRFSGKWIPRCEWGAAAERGSFVVAALPVLAATRPLRAGSRVSSLARFLARSGKIAGGASRCRSRVGRREALVPPAEPGLRGQPVGPAEAGVHPGAATGPPATTPSPSLWRRPGSVIVIVAVIDTVIVAVHVNGNATVVVIAAL